MSIFAAQSVNEIDTEASDRLLDVKNAFTNTPESNTSLQCESIIQEHDKLQWSNVQLATF